METTITIFANVIDEDEVDALIELPRGGCALYHKISKQLEMQDIGDTAVVNGKHNFVNEYNEWEEK